MQISHATLCFKEAYKTLKFPSKKCLKIQICFFFPKCGNIHGIYKVLYESMKLIADPYATIMEVAGPGPEV